MHFKDVGPSTAVSGIGGLHYLVVTTPIALYKGRKPKHRADENGSFAGVILATNCAAPGNCIPMVAHEWVLTMAMVADLC